MISELENQEQAAPKDTLKITFCQTCGEIYRARNMVRLREELTDHIKRTGHEMDIRCAPPFPCEHK